MKELADGTLIVEDPEELRKIAWCAEEIVRIMDELEIPDAMRLSEREVAALADEARRRYEAGGRR